MKKFTMLLTVLFLTGVLGILNAQTQLWSLDFEAAGGYTTSTPEFTDTSSDYWLRTDGSDHASFIVYNSPIGIYYYAGMDIDGEGATIPVFLNVDDIDVSGESNLEFRIYLAEDDASDGNEDWDASDYFHVGYDLDNTGTFTPLLWVRAAGTTNTEPRIDTNFDGVGDGDEITDVFVQYTATIPGAASLLDLELAFNLNSGDEDIGIDHLEVYAAGGNSLPAITNVIQNPTEDITSSTTVEVSADVTDSDGTIDFVELSWGTTSGSLTNFIGMTSTGGDTYATDSDIPAQANGTTVYYQVYAEDNIGDDASSLEMSYQVIDPASTTLPYVETFDADLGDCYVKSVLGDTKSWGFAIYGANGYADINGYGSTETEEDWLVFPAIDFDSYTNEIMSFDTWYQYGTDDVNNYLKLYYSDDYPGIGDPTGFTWTELIYTQGASQAWTSSGIIDLSSIAGTSVYIALKYQYEAGNYRHWEVDNVSIVEAVPVNVTFQVNMNEQVVSPDGVHVAGSFNSWTPGATPMLDGDGDGIYTVTLSLLSPIEYQFKYLNGNAWGTEEGVPTECQAPGTSNRFEVAGDTDYAIPVVCFGSCVDCGILYDYDITFRVDMQNETVAGDGVFIAGEFTGWANAALTNTSGSIWEITYTLTETNYHEYKFKNGADGWEGFNGDCVVWDGGNRFLTVPSENTTYTYCFNSCDVCPVSYTVMINEVDADTPGTDAEEFIELYDGGVGNTDLSGLVVVLFNGSDNASYTPATDLDGESTNAQGYYVLGSALVPNVDTIIGSTNIIQNGADAVALYFGDAVDFPNDTPVTDVNLVDAIVYGTNDGDATTLIDMLTPGEQQVNESGRGNSSMHSNQRIPNGSGGFRMTGTYDQTNPTPGVENVSVFTDWTGAVDSNWDDAGNWTNGVPTALLDATIPDVGTNPYPVISAAANANSIYVAAAATITIAPGADLTAAGQVDVDGGFYMSSNAAGVSASFIDNGVTGGGTFYFDRDLFCSGSTANESDPFGWHYLAAPIDGLTTDDLLDYYVNQWDEVGNAWMNFEGTDPCIPYATEYLDDVEAWSLNLDSDYACPTPGTGNVVEFSGAFWSLHTGGFSTPVTATGGSFSGWNMIGNPYPSAIDPAAFNWTGFDNGTNGVAIYDGCAGNYLYSNLGNGYSYKVGPTQGFFMLTSGATEFALDGSERVHDNGTTIYKDAVTNLLTIEATGDGTSDLAYIRFMEDSQTGMDKADFPKLISTTEGLAQIYTTSGENMLAVNALPSTPIVPMGFTSVTTGEYTISAIEANDFSNVVLEDRFTGEQTDLLTDSYTFNYTVSDDANRFFVHFTPLGIGDNAVASINIWSSDHNIYVQTPEINGDIVVFNMMGQEVTRTQVEAGVNVIPVSEVNAFYVVKIVGSDVAKTGKVYVK